MNRISCLALVAVLALAGCSPKEETIVTGPDGSKVTASKDGSEVTITDDKGNSVNMGNAVSESDLGLPFYPDSQEKPNASMKMEQADAKIVASTRTSKDEPEKVVAFYKDKIEGAKDFNSSGGGMKVATVNGKLKSGADVSVSATRKDGEDTDISVSVSTKK